jgi:hypothetical protein
MRASGKGGRIYEYRAWPEEAETMASTISRSFRPSQTEQRTDDYLLPVRPCGGSYLPKIRGGQKFEVKECLGTQAGMEIWKRVVSQKFPLDPGLRGLLASIYPGVLIPRRALETPRRLVQALAPHVFLCRVRKTRQLYRKGPCKAEVTQIEAFGVPAITVALECGRPGPVLEFLDQAPDPHPPNLNYGDWLRHRLRLGASLSLVWDKAG